VTSTGSLPEWAKTEMTRLAVERDRLAALVTAVDLFRGGAGGWSLALHRLGVPTIGIEMDRDSCLSAAVATGHGRHCTLIDIDSRNAHLARERVGMLLEEAS
jgi:hypothetical protein